jgi:hypothetical protein
LWGAPRIHGELLKLGFEVAESTVSKYMIRRRGPPSQTWRTFLRNHAEAIAAMASTTVNAMLARRGQLEVVVVPDQGHAPLLVEPKVIRRIAAFVASCDVPARDWWSVTDPKSGSAVGFVSSSSATSHLFIHTRGHQDA